MTPVRIGLVGYGKGGRFFHAPLIAGAAGCELAGVVTRSAGLELLEAAQHSADTGLVITLNPGGGAGSGPGRSWQG